MKAYDKFTGSMTDSYDQELRNWSKTDKFDKNFSFGQGRSPISTTHSPTTTPATRTASCALDFNQTEFHVQHENLRYNTIINDFSKRRKLLLSKIMNFVKLSKEMPATSL